LSYQLLAPVSDFARFDSVNAHDDRSVTASTTAFWGLPDAPRIEFCLKPVDPLAQR
jgi:hypothetical protein